MHIEPGVVTGAKIALSYATAAGAAGYSARLALAALSEKGALSLLARSALATALTLVFFELLPTFSVGVSEVHLILGTTLFLVFGAAPAALGLATGLALQGLLFAPADLPQYFMNVTTLLVPLLLIREIARRHIADDTAYVDLRYGQVLRLSAAYQGGIVAWVAFWALLGQGADMANLAAIGTFGLAYLSVIVLEPLVDLGVLAGAKALRGLRGSGLVTHRLHNPA